MCDNDIVVGGRFVDVVTAFRGDGAMLRLREFTAVSLGFLANAFEAFA
jgi:hypothetical protein